MNKLEDELSKATLEFLDDLIDKGLLCIFDQDSRTLKAIESVHINGQGIQFNAEKWDTSSHEDIVRELKEKNFEYVIEVVDLRRKLKELQGDNDE